MPYRATRRATGWPLSRPASTSSTSISAHPDRTTHGPRGREAEATARGPCDRRATQGLWTDRGHGRDLGAVALGSRAEGSGS